LKDAEFVKKTYSMYLLMLISNFIEDMDAGNTEKRRKEGVCGRQNSMCISA
jgi:hypothetical protein